VGLGQKMLGSLSRSTLPSFSTSRRQLRLLHWQMPSAACRSSHHLCACKLTRRHIPAIVHPHLPVRHLLLRRGNGQHNREGQTLTLTHNSSTCVTRRLQVF